MLDKTVNFFLVHATIVLPAAVLLALLVSSTARRGVQLLLRLIARPLLIAAVVALVYDGSRTLAGGSGFVVTSLIEHWQAYSPATLEAAKALVAAHIHPQAWEVGVLRVLQLPAWLVIGVLGMALSWIGRRRKEIAIFVN
ncbi:MAG: hypothetical protein SFW09_23960 [Hyphomicrobiaceae bacterium]|nr:hypothetical protein [Hyphomicrobiaceae bacterium]